MYGNIFKKPLTLYIQYMLVIIVNRVSMKKNNAEMKM